ncbi:MAG: RNA 2',3'-cyclic phosphodiesterase [Desulfobacteraceae bacterium]|nr:RNA 2',3'-cyclic phosphodiesterase [Desulfobacteraceae bacterium]MBC2754735.1 RNA 2',3'-cyclic phosphodiesterase [Desulfobacteraceae bacterium]
MSEKAPSGGKNSGPANIRTFIAVKLPDHVIRRLSESQQDLKKHDLRIRWTRPENIHLTLKFLGDIHPDDVGPVCQVIEASVKEFGSIALCVRGVGVFPGIRRPRVLWTGISGQTDVLEKLHKAIDVGLSDLGFAKDERRFTGHLTLGRFKGHPDSDILINIMKTYVDMASDEFLVDAVHVYQSDLKPSGPVYTNLSSIRLGQ